MIKLTDVTKTYTTESIKTEVLKGINLEVKDGEFIAIMGASGSGKSTLLHIIGGMDSLTSGEYMYNDEHISEFSVKKLNDFRRNKIGFVFQNAALIKYISVYENVEVPLLSGNLKTSQRKKTVREYLDKTGVLELEHKLPMHLSGGEQMRVALARALVAGNELILADEPTGALDQDNGRKIMELLTQVREMGRTIILITHDPDVAAYADRIVRIKDGVIAPMSEKYNGNC